MHSILPHEAPNMLLPPKHEHVRIRQRCCSISCCHPAQQPFHCTSEEPQEGGHEIPAKRRKERKVGWGRQGCPKAWRACTSVHPLPGRDRLFLYCWCMLPGCVPHPWVTLPNWIATQAWETQHLCTTTRQHGEQGPVCPAKHTALPSLLSATHARHSWP